MSLYNPYPIVDFRTPTHRRHINYRPNTYLPDVLGDPSYFNSQWLYRGVQGDYWNYRDSPALYSQHLKVRLFEEGWEPGTAGFLRKYNQKMSEQFFPEEIEKAVLSGMERQDYTSRFNYNAHLARRNYNAQKTARDELISMNQDAAGLGIVEDEFAADEVLNLEEVYGADLEDIEEQAGRGLIYEKQKAKRNFALD